MSNWDEQVFETLSRLDANGEKKSLAASVTAPKDDQLCASLIEERIKDKKSLAASVTSTNDNPAMEIYNSTFGIE